MKPIPLTKNACLAPRSITCYPDIKNIRMFFISLLNEYFILKQNYNKLTTYSS